MVEANANKVILLVPNSFKSDEQGWAAKFSTENMAVSVVTSKKPTNKFCGVIIYALESDEEGSEECRNFFKNTYKNVPAFVEMKEGNHDNLMSQLTANIEKARESIKAVFCKFDKDNSGFIDKNELKMAIAETGVTMNNMDVYNMM